MVMARTLHFYGGPLDGDTRSWSAVESPPACHYIPVPPRPDFTRPSTPGTGLLVQQTYALRARSRDGAHFRYQYLGEE